MTPQEFHQQVLPTIIEKWENDCFCASPGFRKLLSFDFHDYRISPTMLADSEILIHEIVRQRFVSIADPDSNQGVTTQLYHCPQCGAACTETYAEFSISMYQSHVAFTGGPSPAPRGDFLVGFAGFEAADFARITDFRQATGIDAFLQQLHVN